MGLAGKDARQMYCVTSYGSQRNPHRHTSEEKCLQWDRLPMRTVAVLDGTSNS